MSDIGRKKVLLKAPILTQSGYGEQSRFALRALRSREDLYDIHIIPMSWGQTSWIVEDNEENREKVRQTKKAMDALEKFNSVALEEDSEGEETYNYGADEGHDEYRLKHDDMSRSHRSALKKDMGYDEDHEDRGEYGTHFESVDNLYHKSQLEQLDLMVEKENELLGEVSNYHFWVEGFPSIRRWMIESFLPSFEEQTNSFLNNLEIGMRVRFDTIKEKKSKQNEFKEEFDLSIIDENNEKRDLETYSQGESKRIGVCVGFALRELTLNKGYSNFNFLLMDEVIDSLDETGIGEFMNLLNNITGMKLLITHNSDLKSRFGNVIRVTKTEGISDIIQS